MRYGTENWVVAKGKEGIKAHNSTKGAVQFSPTPDGCVALGHGRCKPRRGKTMLKNVPLSISSGFPSLAELHENRRLGRHNAEMSSPAALQEPSLALCPALGTRCCGGEKSSPKETLGVSVQSRGVQRKGPQVIPYHTGRRR